MFIKLFLGALLIIAAFGLWNNHSGINVSFRQITACVLGILGFMIILPAVLSFAFSGFVTIVIIIAVIMLMKLIF